MDQTHKQDEGKLQLSLVPVEIIREIARVRAYGNAKYNGSTAWRCVDPARYVDAFLRHVVAYWGGEEIDPESGLKHLSHAACNLAFILEMEADDETEK